MRKPMIAGNWKMHKTGSEAVELVNAIKEKKGSEGAVEIVVAPPFTALGAVAPLLEGASVKLGAQNLFWEESGAYTGEISAGMLKDVGCDYVIIGHSERREHFHETDHGVNRKIVAALKANLVPIVCVGESLDEREAGKVESVIEGQVISGLKGFSPEEGGRMVIAYEPVWAIGTGKTATPEQANVVHQLIRKLLTRLFGQEVAGKVRILYGGSVKPGNAAELLSEKEIDGALVGGASLEADSFAAIIDAASVEG